MRKFSVSTGSQFQINQYFIPSTGTILNSEKDEDQCFRYKIKTSITMGQYGNTYILVFITHDKFGFRVREVFQ